MKIVTILGARPQFIKASALSRLFAREPRCQELLVHTGQHYDDNMSDVFFQELGIPKPAYHLGVGGGSHGAMTGRMLEKIEQVLLTEKPDIVLVYGDTNSTLAGALAAAKLHIPTAHVEAGLRSFNRRMPEEINRVLTDHLSTWLFAPTHAAVTNLQAEGIVGAKVELVGDVMYDVTLEFGQKPLDVSKWGLTSKNFILATIHRAENTDVPERLHAVFGGLEQIAREIPVVLPLHPRTRGALTKHAVLQADSPLRLLDPVGYVEMTALQRHCRAIVTDSGGVQKEAFFHRVPCITLRDETEWVELVELGWNRLLPPLSVQAVYNGVKAALAAPLGQTPPADLYGGGQAAARIVARLLA